MATFLFKTEPAEYSFDDLRRDGTTTWDGVSNPQALAALRACRAGDEVFIYHTGEERRIVGTAAVERGPGDAAAKPAPKPGAGPAKKPKAPPAADPAVVIRAGAALKRPVTLAEIKSDPRFAEFALVRQGRLSVMPVPAMLAKALRQMGGLPSR